MRPSSLFLTAWLAALGCAHGPSVAPPAEPAPAPAAPAVPSPVPAAPSPAAAPCGLDVSRLVGDELSLRPAAGPEDLYALVREAVLGEPPSDPATARSRLEAELDAAGPPRREEPIVEDLDEVQGTVRVNLRRWRFIRASAEELWPVIEASARAIGPGDRSRFAACLDRAGAVLAARGADAAVFRAFVAGRATEGLPPVAHGRTYREAYAPSYRVVLRRFLPPWVTAPPPEAG